MLDQLDRLDDATPPDADDAMLRRVRGRANHLRRRFRIVTTTAVVVPLLALGAVAAIASRNTTNVEVITPSTRPTTRAGLSSAGTLPDGLHIEMTVETPTVQLGRDITAKVVVSNPSFTTMTIGSGDLQCAVGVGPALRDARGDTTVAEWPPGDNCLRVHAFGPGRTKTFTTSLSTKSVTLKQGARLGHFEMTLTTANTFHQLVGPLGLKAVPVEIVAPDLTGQLELSSSQVVDGGTITGFVVFDNAGHSDVSAGCSTHRDYQIALAADGVVIRDPRALQLNPDAPCLRSQLLLEPGTTRLPFKVPATYFGCTTQVTDDLLGLPRCIGHLKTPALPAGNYQVVFTGAGALGAVAVAPAPVLVVVPNPQKAAVPTEITQNG